MTPRFIIVVDKISNERGEVAHNLIKARAKGYWHHLANVWIVGGQDAATWRDIVRPVIEGTGATVLVMKLPQEQAERKWGLFGPESKKKGEWLFQDYSGVDPPSE